MLDTTISGRTQALLDTFGGALESNDISSATGMFVEDCYWRDLVSFTWNLKTLEAGTRLVACSNNSLRR